MKFINQLLGMLRKYIPFRHRGTRKEAVKFIRKLSVLLNSGVSVNKALRMIAQGHQLAGNYHSYGFVNMLSRGIEEGRSLYEVLGTQARHFDTMTLSLIKVGEESGQLPQVLIKILEYLDKQTKYRKKLKQALTYPIIVLGIASLTVVFLTYFLLPMFGEMYRDMDMELPAFTRTLLAISEHGGLYLTILVSVIISLTLGVKWLSRIPAVNQKLIAGITKAPLIGGMTSKFVTMYYSQILATLLESGLTLLHGLEICQQISRKGLMQQFFGFVIKSLKEGRSFSDILTITAMLDFEYVQLIQLSEESGELKPTMDQISDQVSAELEDKLENIGAILEPLIIVIVGFTVGAVIIGMYLPIFEMSANINF